MLTGRVRASIATSGRSGDEHGRQTAGGQFASQGASEMKRTNYEWLVEQIDADGDVIDCSHFDTALAAVAWAAGLGAGVRYDIALVRDVECEFDGVIERVWAYVVDGKLPEWAVEFDREAFGTEGVRRRVPQRYLREWARVSNKQDK